MCLDSAYSYLCELQIVPSPRRPDARRGISWRRSPSVALFLRCTLYSFGLCYLHILRNMFGSEESSIAPLSEHHRRRGLWRTLLCARPRCPHEHAQGFRTQCGARVFARGFETLRARSSKWPTTTATMGLCKSSCPFIPPKETPSR